MRTRSKLTLAVLTATLVLGLAVGSAAANRLSVSNRLFRATWLELKIVDDPITVGCPVTLEGSFHSTTIRKVEGALIGAVTRAIVNGAEPPCRGGRATLLQESLPWHVTYDDFEGVLPRIEQILLLLRRYEYRIETTILGIRVACLYLDQNRPEEAQTLLLTVGASGQITTIQASPFGDSYGSWRSGSELCPRRTEFQGTGQLFLLGSSTTRISVRLI
jgi:hypothetical protein